ncbi:MAG: monovalent cation/H+ antiporter subunit D [Acidovorax sp.]|uniref:monovalent cation/H+ antiporter subunit D n=1 Tax=Acidovorax sp. TaxID=1872122 RepID=UPI00391B4736
MIGELLNSFFGQHLPVLPVLLPMFTAVALLLIGDGGGQSSHGGTQLRARRWVSMTSVIFGAVLAWRLLTEAASGPLTVYPLGAWPAPFGIVLVIDRLSALMLALTWTIAAPVLWYSTGGWDSHGRHFHALFHFQLMGLSGAFITGDLFNLFVFFEVLLIASYVLMVHGQGRDRFRAGLHYVVLNLAASALFLIGLAIIYAVTGTLNMADLALRITQLEPEQASLLKAGAMVLLVVFGLKAAIAPLYMWLPTTYAAASAPVAALFAIMTKVGVYSIIRVHAVMLGEGAGHAAFAAAPWLLPIALLTTVLGVFGALAAHSLAQLVSYLTVSSIGIILAAVGLFTPESMSAALYYTVHSTLVMAALFLLVELVAAQRGAAGDHLQPAPPVAQPVALGLMTLLGAASAAGLPPLPGFLGKLMVLESAAATPAHTWVWAVVLGAGFLTLVGLARAGAILFWNVLPGRPDDCSAGSSGRLMTATLSLLALSLLLAVAASPLKRYTDATAAQLADRNGYADAVLNAVGGSAAQTTRPYRGGEGEVKLPGKAVAP